MNGGSPNHKQIPPCSPRRHEATVFVSAGDARPSYSIWQRTTARNRKRLQRRMIMLLRALCSDGGSSRPI